MKSFLKLIKWWISGLVAVVYAKEKIDRTQRGFLWHTANSRRKFGTIISVRVIEFPLFSASAGHRVSTFPTQELPSF
jgi:hypothetical protein